jgi:hypothetical protein
MSATAKGTVLTCAHEHCGCRVLIEEECHCSGVNAESSYQCACGAPLVPVEGTRPGSAGLGPAAF